MKTHNSFSRSGKFLAYLLMGSILFGSGYVAGFNAKFMSRLMVFIYYTGYKDGQMYAIREGKATY